MATATHGLGCALAIGILSAAAFANPAAAAPELSFDDAEPASEVVDRFVRWVKASEDHGDRPFAVVDKVRAQVFVYSGKGKLIGSAPVLLGSAFGDETAPGIGDLQLASIPADQRTTAAGRFESFLGPATGESPEVLWIDYDSGLSMHPVIRGAQKQRRKERLATETPLDNRITYGCINVPVAFYEEVVRPAFAEKGMVYILPETRDLEAVFTDFRWNRKARRVAASDREGQREVSGGVIETDAARLTTLLGF